MTKRILLVLIMLVSVLSTQAASIHAKIAKAQRSIPLRQETFSLDALSYNDEEDAVEGSFTYFSNSIDTDIQAQVQMIATVLGMFMTSDPDMEPFNLILSVKTPDSSQPKTFSYTKGTVAIYMNEVRRIFNNDDSLLQILTNELDNIPMQCDAENNFCYTMSFNSQRKEILLDYQLLSDQYITAYESSENVFTGSILKQMGTALKAYEHVMKKENITLKISLYKGTDSKPLQVYRISADELFAD